MQPYTESSRYLALMPGADVCTLQSPAAQDIRCHAMPCKRVLPAVRRTRCGGGGKQLAYQTSDRICTEDLS